MNIRLVKIISWFIGLIVIVNLTFSVLKPKYYFADEERKSPETENWEDFYKLPQNSLDIVFFGSSHMYNGVDSMQFYLKTGLRCFDLASSSQDMMTTYYYLCELLRYQSPSCIVIDTYGMKNHEYPDANAFKRAFQNMKYTSPVRYAAINNYVTNNENNEDNDKQLKYELLFPFLEYHSRWETLTKCDFTPGAYDISEMGFVMTAEQEPNDVKGYGEKREPEPNEYVLDYYEKIEKLCEEREIELIFITIPYKKFTASLAEYFTNFFEKEGIRYINYQDPEIYNEIGLDNATDWWSSGHLNWRGAEKFTEYIINDFQEKGIITARAIDENDYVYGLREQYEEKTLIIELESSYSIQEYIDSIARHQDEVDVRIYECVESDGSEDESDETNELRQWLENRGYILENVSEDGIIIGNKDYSIDDNGIEFVITKKGTTRVYDAVLFRNENEYIRIEK